MFKSSKNKFTSIYDLFDNVNICVVITPSTVVVNRIKLYGNLILLHALANSNDFKYILFTFNNFSLIIYYK